MHGVHGELLLLGVRDVRIFFFGRWLFDAPLFCECVVYLFVVVACVHTR